MTRQEQTNNDPEDTAEGLTSSNPKINKKEAQEHLENRQSTDTKLSKVVAKKSTEHTLPNNQTVGLVLLGTYPNFAAYSKFGQSSSPTRENDSRKDGLELKHLKRDWIIAEDPGKLDRRVSGSDSNMLSFVKNVWVNSEPNVADVDSGHDSDSCNNDLSGSFLSPYTTVGLSNSYTDLSSAKTDYKISADVPKPKGIYSKFGLISSIPFNEKLHLDPALLNYSSSPGYVTISQFESSSKEVPNGHKSHCKRNVNPLEIKSPSDNSQSSQFIRDTPVNRNACRDSGVSISSPTAEPTPPFNGYVPNSIANNAATPDGKDIVNDSIANGKTIALSKMTSTGYVPVNNIHLMFPFDELQPANKPPKDIACSVNESPRSCSDHQFSNGYISCERFLQSDDGNLLTSTSSVLV